MRITKLFSSILFLLLVFTASGCPKAEKAAYETAVGAKAFTQSIKDKHTECENQANTMPVCQALRRAIAFKDLLIDAGEVYCGGAQFETGGACNPPAKGTPAAKLALDKLNAAVSNWKQADSDLRAALSQ
jgi:uncharacterized protein (DUF169 family)